MQAPKLLWTPEASPLVPRQMDAFRALISKKYDLKLDSYEELHQWSISEPERFWEEIWGFTNVISSAPWDSVLDTTVKMDAIPKWFRGAKLNWAENQLRRTDSKVALIEVSEPMAGEALSYDRISYAELYHRVYLVSLALRKLGLKENEVFGYYGPTSSASVILLLAVNSIGAIWSSAAADFGAVGVVERFSQLDLWGIVGVNAVRYNGKVLDQREKLETVVESLEKTRSEKLHVFVVDYLKEGKRVGEERMMLDELIALGQAEADRLGVVKGQEKIDFYQSDFSQPIFILFSSGTTGKPKAIVHGAGGMLLQSSKEHVLHGNLSESSVFFYYTTPGWMMWNYLVSALSTGATLVLFDGSPLFKPAVLWTMAEDLGVTVFGTSAKYLDVLSKGYSPNKHHDLSKITQVLSTGSPLTAQLYEWVYENIGSNLMLGSITGGTDICSLFAAHNVSLPVYAGEIQCIALGMAIESWSEEGKKVSDGEPGELVCIKPFPCMPVSFFGDAGGARYHASYFEKFNGVWAHGDFCMITPERRGVIMLGRSDGVLNPSGIRFGSSEIYDVVDTFQGIVEESLVIGQKIQKGSDERVVLFLKLCAGQALDEKLIKEIKLKIRTVRSARHVPERILAVTDIPHTVNGKKVEIPVKKLLNGLPLSEINFSTLRNPECLPEYVALGEKLRAEVE